MPRGWSARDVAATGAIIGSMLALGYALAAVPNVELVTLTAFMGGWMVGAGRGAIAGGTGMFLFSLFNPLGPALPPVHAAQTLGMAMTGAAGGWTRAALARHRSFLDRLAAGPVRIPWFPGFACALGAAITLAYDALTNAGTAVAMGMTGQFIKVLFAGIAFSLVHIVSNAVVFALVAPMAIFLVEKRRAGEYPPGP